MQANKKPELRISVITEEETFDEGEQTFCEESPFSPYR